MKRDVAPSKVAYLLKTFPRLSETFILNEIVGLERLGTKLHIFSLKRPESEPVHAAVGEVSAGVTYALSLGPRSRPLDALRVVGHHLRLILTAPGRYWGTAREYFSRAGRVRAKDFLQAGYLSGEIRKQGCTHVHAHFANVPTTVAELIQGLTGLPYSFTAHAKDIYLSDPAELDRKMRGAEFVLTCTGYNRAYLAGIHSGSTPIHLAYHGVDLKLFSPEGPPAAERGARILSVGRLCEKKGLADLIRACGILRDRQVGLACTIVGEGPQREELQSLICQLRLEDLVTLAGKMAHQQVLRHYQEAAVFALPCVITTDGDRDGIPNVLLEAMAMEIPAISTPVSGIGELIQHRKNGLLTPPHNPEALADALQTVLENRELRGTLGRAGRRSVLNLFSLEMSASRVSQLLRVALDDGQCGISADSDAVKSATVMAQ